MERMRAIVVSCMLMLTASVQPKAAEQQVHPASHVTAFASVAGIDNFFQLGTNLYSGGAPEGKEGFATLGKLGVKTIITVDGAQPDVELAKSFGIRYVHLPHGYDGISTTVELQLIKAAETLPGPIFIHCHHGKHRGPTAAAVICMAKEGWTRTEAEQWLVTAGTATNYIGLYNVVRNFQTPSPALLQSVPTNFPEIAPVIGLSHTMVAIDERWDHLKMVARGSLSAKTTNFNASHEVAMLREHYREAQRLPDAAERGQEFLDLLKRAEANAGEAERLLQSSDATMTPPAVREKTDRRTPLDRSFAAMAQDCSSCHQVYRDLDGAKKAGQ